MKKIDLSDTTHKKYSFHYPHHHAIKWNVNDANSKSVSSGIYLLRIEAGNFKETRKILVVK